MSNTITASVGSLTVTVLRGSGSQRPTIRVEDSGQTVLLDRLDLMSAKARTRVAALAPDDNAVEAMERALLDLAQQLAVTPPAAEAASGARGVLVSTTTPSEYPVVLADVLNVSRTQVSQYAVLPAFGAVVLTLWTMLTHFVDYLHYFGILHVVSATRESGKTRVLELGHLLSARAWTIVDPTLSTLFRTIESHAPTVFIDEVDTLSDNKRSEFTALLNDGVRRGGCTVRSVESKDGGHQVTTFAIFGPKAIGSIGVNLTDATVSRTIRFTMQRAGTAELQALKAFRMDRAERWAGPLRGMMARAALDFGPALAALLDGDDDDPRVILPEGVDGRQAQIWEPLIALADLAGGEWPSLARAACREFVAGVRDADAPDPKVRLLADVRDYFGTTGEGFVTSDTLIKWLTADEARGWQEYHRDKPITPHAIARLLRPFHLKPALRRSPDLPDGRARAWSRAEFIPVWDRYLSEKTNTPPSQETVTSVTSVTSVTNDPTPTKASVTLVTDVTPRSLVTLPQTPPENKKTGLVRVTWTNGETIELAADDADLTELAHLIAHVEPLAA